MPTNIEIKARVEDLEWLKNCAAELSGEDGTVLEQHDTFFNVPNGRLKLRQFKNADTQSAQLIFYERSDESGPKTSKYSITQCDNPEDLKGTLKQALGTKGEVRKKRTLYMVGQTRVHVDQVKGLGNFMELEVVMKENQSLEEGQEIANDLMKKLEIKAEDLLTGAYMDLILKS